MKRLREHKWVIVYGLFVLFIYIVVSLKTQNHQMLTVKEIRYRTQKFYRLLGTGLTNTTKCTFSNGTTIRIWKYDTGYINVSDNKITNKCIFDEDVAIIIPFRDRAKNLSVLLPHLHVILHESHISFRIFVIEMALPTMFNRGFLINVGFILAREIGNYRCYVFHDVDLIPLSDGEIYRCKTKPTHLSSSNSKYGGKLPYENYIGGVMMVRGEDFQLINGFANAYFGWGGEDDDILVRMNAKNLPVDRLNPAVGRYSAMNHGPDKSNPENLRKDLLLETALDRVTTDGLNSVNFRILSYRFGVVYTWFLVEHL